MGHSWSHTPIGHQGRVCRVSFRKGRGPKVLGHDSTVMSSPSVVPRLRVHGLPPYFVRVVSPFLSTLSVGGTCSGDSGPYL